MDNLNVKQAVPFFWITNMDKSLEFYIKSLDFTLTNKWEPNGKIEWCWLQLGNTAIMLQEYKQKPFYEKFGEGVSIYFICDEALPIYNRIISKGIIASEPFVGNNMWVVTLADPDGYSIHFTSPTDVSEGTKYSDWLKNNDK